METEQLNQVSGQIVDAAFHIHSKLGPGLLESVYEVILAKELQRRGFYVERQKPVPIEFEGLQFEEGFRADLIVEHVIVVELKSVEALAPVHYKQVLTYLRLLDYRLGLLINFGAAVLKDGIKRIVNNF
jgi:GxxExxY protein